MEQLHTEIISEEASSKARDTGFKQFIIDIIETLVISIILFAVINAITARIRVDGSSMEPTLKSGEFVIVNKLAYRFGKPKIGDVIVFHFPRDPQQEYIKRILGLPGDRVVVSGGQLYINGEQIKENYISSIPAYDLSLEVPADSLVVLGDNRNNSSDSHNWGAVPLKNVVGKAVFVYWPPTSWGRIDHPLIASAAP